MNTKNDIIKKYSAYISNLEWNIKNNEFGGERLNTLNGHIAIYKSIVTDLEQLPETITTPVENYPIRTAEEKLQQAAEEKYPSDYSLAQSNNKFRQEGFIAGAKSDAAREYWRGRQTSGFIPGDLMVSEWYEENIDKDCSASSAIYKFRVWLKSLQAQ